MNNVKKLMLGAAVALSTLGGVVVEMQPAKAQLIVVKKDYYVTELLPGKMKLGIAEEKGKETRNWVCIKDTTKVNMREWDGHAFRDKRIAPVDIYKHLKIGQRFQVEGGRDWDQTIVAKKIWF
jgi:hypothetical protein